ncbi:hypothetical protein [Adhaeribacter pallidiroseus]|uniref:Uncharacterized protein n=1 Tax=Adhaeribacter pallidiroseus TaxID=2072847 RepID=A0A369QP16_9BACT|nr:hypothetical protein [Adhaeribacter pallidiroseus]RDC64589.1 hypothetical protein AHMF7616_03205 [Adhaeribacter pallidiroseus]
MKKIYLAAILIMHWGCSPEQEKTNQKSNNLEVKALNDSTVVIKKKDKIDTVKIDLGPDFIFAWKDAHEFTKNFTVFLKTIKPILALLIKSEKLM